MKKHLLTVFYLFFIFLHPGITLAEDWTLVQAEGSLPKSEENVDVKKSALDQAIRKAVSAALDSLIKQDSITLKPVQADSIEAGIYSNPRNFILNYRIISEGWITHMDVTPPPAPAATTAAPNQAGVELYHVWIEANIDAAQLKGLLNRTTQDESTAFITLTILGVTDYNTYRNLLSSIERITVVNDISYDSFYKGRIVLTAKINGSAQALSERLTKEVAEGFAVIPGGPQAIVIKALNKPQTTDQSR